MGGAQCVGEIRKTVEVQPSGRQGENDEHDGARDGDREHLPQARVECRGGRAEEQADERKERRRAAEPARVARSGGGDRDNGEQADRAERGPHRQGKSSGCRSFAYCSTPSASRGPGRLTRSGSIATTHRFFTASIADQPGRAATASGVIP